MIKCKKKKKEGGKGKKRWEMKKKQKKELYHFHLAFKNLEKITKDPGIVGLENCFSYLIIPQKLSKKEIALTHIKSNAPKRNSQ